MKDLILGNLSTILLTALAVLGFILGGSAVRKRRVALATYHAFHVVEDLVAETNSTPSPVLDKALKGLEVADKYMLANGWRPLKPGEQEVAKLTFKSMNAQADATVAAVVSAVAPTLSPK